MNGYRNSVSELQAITQGYDLETRSRMDLLVCVPATLLYVCSVTALGSRVAVGGQDCHFNTLGAHTGDISADMIVDSGGTSVIVGHSERRADHGESNATVKSKAEAGLRAGLQVIVCIGETEEERKSGKTLDVLGTQLDGSLPVLEAGHDLVVAYEPVWAIGTGLVPTVDDVRDAHAFIREKLNGHYGERGNAIRILYGGSVKPSNAGELMAVENVNGALVGGASLKAADFLGICEAVGGVCI